MLRGRGRRAAISVLVAALTGALAVGCGRGSSGGDATDAKKPERFASSGQLPEHLAADGTTVVVGSSKADTVVRLYEDLRCPVCRDFEEDGGAGALRKMTLHGEVRTEYTLASFLDDRLGGKGSKKAANALRAALEKGKFVEYHDLLFQEQPEEAVDGYTDAFLLRMASRVKGLRGPEFDAAVKGMKYRSFVTASEKAFEADKASGTPAFAVNGTLLKEDRRNLMFDPKYVPLAVRTSTLSE
ncbi:DsbA family protein [Streptomyces sp. NBC_01003]|uniref:DsbA family protein n=1 Tax=Streptomyces sp. NBC_01003 TaxID=2903714 RepID=UPI00386B2438|nr:DsbA family protein [Streptomyces sp. NBC_01003]